MNYEKKYKEALGRARICRKDLMNLDGVVACMAKDFFEETFPELKDSKDEKTKREIMEYITHYKDSLDDDEYRTWISWLEKQGEQKTADEVSPKFKVGDTIKYFGERQELSESKHTIEEIKNDMYVTTLGALIPLRYEDNYELVEQKPIDNVGPKFKVGDWIINNDKRIAIPTQILKIEKYGYITSSGYTSFDKVKTDYHLWTIQDAKDGDVLVTKKGNPFLYDKNRYNNELAYYYVGLDVNKELVSKSHHRMLSHFGKLSSISPATKKQCDLLFQKMKESGYEWDGEKKELRKIDAKENLTLDGDLMQADCMVVEQYSLLENRNVSPLLYGVIDSKKREILLEKLEEIYNVLGIDTEFNTPDYLLAEYTLNCLVSYGNALTKNIEKAKWKM